jgi:hypothetical protein
MVRVSKPTLHCHGCSIFRCSKENNYEHTIKMLVQISFLVMMALKTYLQEF